MTATTDTATWSWTTIRHLRRTRDAVLARPTPDQMTLADAFALEAGAVADGLAWAPSESYCNPVRRAS